MNILNLIGRNVAFLEDLNNVESHLSQVVTDSRFLVIGGAGSIGHSLLWKF